MQGFKTADEFSVGLRERIVLPQFQFLARTLIVAQSMEIIGNVAAKKDVLASSWRDGACGAEKEKVVERGVDGSGFNFAGKCDALTRQGGRDSCFPMSQNRDMGHPFSC